MPRCSSATASNPPDVYGFGHARFIEHVVASILDGKAIAVDGRQGRKSLRLITAIYESIESGQEVALHVEPRHSRLGLRVKKRANVLLTSAGTATAVNVTRALRGSRHFDVRLVAVDHDLLAAGLYLADAHCVVPSSKDPAFMASILEIRRREAIDFVFPLHSTEVSVFSRARSALREAGVRMCVPEPPVVELCVEKDRFAAFLRERDFPFPRSYARAVDVAEYPVFLKPRTGSSSTNTFKAADREELEYLLRRHPTSLIQAYVAWPEVTVDCFVSQSGALVGCVPRYRRRVKDGKSVVAETAELPHVVVEVRRLLGALGLRGPCNVQLFVNDDGEIRFVEVNPRLAAGGLPLATHVGTNIPELMLREASGEQLSELIPFKPGVTPLLQRAVPR